MNRDFTPTKETISLHGLGFIQVVLGGNQRLHIWHPDLPRRRCFEHSAIHNHRFGFTSRVLKGTQVNQRVDIEIVKPETGTHVLISHNGPRSEKGGRLSFPVADINVFSGWREIYEAGQEYTMAPMEYHYTPNAGVVVTLLTKTKETKQHACSTCRQGIEFDYDFDRFQLSPAELLAYVNEALR